MSKMSDAWLKACITYNAERNMGDSFSNKMYSAELDYRAQNGIFIEDVD
jgi:hypothetical protein